MAEFVIKLADDRGRMMEQTQAAATADELRARFTQAGYYVYSVKPKGIAIPGLSSRRKKVKLETFLVFNQQFLTLIRAGITILNAMDLLARRQKDLAFRAQLLDAAQRVRNGESVSSAFEAQETFPLIYVTTLMAGEKSGNLEEVLGRYLAFQRITLTFTKKLKASLVYPALLVVLVTCLFLFLIGFVVPRFAQLYDQIGSKLPTLTIIMLEMGRGLSTTSSTRCPSSPSSSTSSFAGPRPSAAPPSWTAFACACPSSATSGSSIRLHSSRELSRLCCRAASRWSRPFRPRPNPWAAAA